MLTNNILLIEDDQLIGKQLKSILQNEKFNVETACDGEQGVAHIAAERPNTVLLDLKLGKMSGYDVLAYVKNKFPEIKVIIMTGSDIKYKMELFGRTKYVTDKKEEQQMKTLQLADGVLTKPFDIEELLSQLKSSSSDDLK